MIVISGRGVPALTDRIDHSTRICADPWPVPGRGPRFAGVSAPGRDGQLADIPLFVASSRTLLQPGSG
jgi:hypothetical protein